MIQVKGNNNNNWNISLSEIKCYNCNGFNHISRHDIDQCINDTVTKEIGW